MAKLPAVSAKDLIRALERDGFLVLRQKGSHIVIQKKTPQEVITTVVPNHSEIAKGKDKPRAAYKIADGYPGSNPFA